MTTDTTKLPETLYTAIGIFEAGPEWNVEVSVPNFPTREDANAYAGAFQIMLVDGRLRRDDGKESGIFDESWREVLDSHAALFRMKAAEGVRERVDLPISQWHSAPGFVPDFQPIAWDTVPDTI